MRLLCSLIVMFVLAGAATGASAGRPEPVNAVWGDASFVAAFGRSPRAGDYDQLRIQTHLAFVEQWLRAHEELAIGAAQRARRHAALDALARYTARGEFPRRGDDGYGERRPRFIDDRGVHCAVGQLIADSGEEGLARAIAAEFEYAYVPDIELPALRAWAEHMGFSVRELAMIQPSYPSKPTVSETHDFVVAAVDVAALECARTLPMPAKLALTVTGLRNKFDYYASFAPVRDPFGRCVVDKLSAWSVSHGRFAVQSENTKLRFPFSIKAKLGTVQGLLQRSFDQVAAGGIYSTSDERALGKLGPEHDARMVTIDAASDQTGATLSVTSTPSDPVVEAAIRAIFERWIVEVGAGAWSVKLNDRRSVAAWKNLRSLGYGIEDAAANADDPCWQPASGEHTVTVKAKVDAKGVLTVSTTARDGELRTCVDRLLAEHLAETKLSAGGEVSRTWRFPVGPPPPASAADVSDHIANNLDAAASRCARTHPVPPSITLRATGIRRVLGYRAVFATPSGAFERCVTNELAATDVTSCRLRSCPEYPNIKFPLSITRSLGAQALYQRRFDTLAAELYVEQGLLDGESGPSPYEKLKASDGTRRVTIDITPGSAGASFTLQTTPRDARVEAILAETFRPVVKQLGAGAPGVKVHDERTVDAWINAIEVRSGTFDLHLACTQAASGESRAVTTIKVAADATVTVDTDLADPDVRACLTRHVTDELGNVTSLRRGAPTAYTLTTLLRPPGYHDPR